MACLIRLLPRASRTRSRTFNIFPPNSYRHSDKARHFREYFTSTIVDKSRYRTTLTSPKYYSTVDPSEVQNFEDYAKKIWAEQGEYELLHLMNRIRVPYILEMVLGSNIGNSANPLEGKTVLDVGCGGGILSEPLARLGANVTGIDASETSIEVAKLHSQTEPKLASQLQYRHEDIINLQGVKFDAVVASEVIEHVADVDLFLDGCCRLVKPGGSFVITTINRTRLSYLLTITMAENLLRVVPRGMHDWQKYIKPGKLKRKLSSRGFVTTDTRGMLYNPLSNRWSWQKDVDVNYALHAVKMEMTFPGVDSDAHEQT